MSRRKAILLILFEVLLAGWLCCLPKDLFKGTSYSGKLTSGAQDVTFNLRAAEADWGRYLVVVRDVAGGHIAGQTVVIDWPAYKGRSGREDPSALSMLTFAADKDSYRAGEKAKVYIPAAQGGQALVSLENAAGVIAREWVSTDASKDTPYTFTVTPEMAPNFYVRDVEPDRLRFPFGVLPNFESAAALQVHGDAGVALLGLVARIGQHPFRHRVILEDFHVRSEHPDEPVPGGSEVFRPDTDLLDAGNVESARVLHTFVMICNLTKITFILFIFVCRNTEFKLKPICVVSVCGPFWPCRPPFWRPAPPREPKPWTLLSPTTSRPTRAAW